MDNRSERYTDWIDIDENKQSQQQPQQNKRESESHQTSNSNISDMFGHQTTFKTMGSRDVDKIADLQKGTPTFTIAEKHRGYDTTHSVIDFQKPYQTMDDQNNNSLNKQGLRNGITKSRQFSN